MRRLILRVLLIAGMLWIGVSAPAQSAKPDEFSAPMEVVHGKPFVDVVVNDKGPYRFLIDTGTSGEAIISPELADELKLPFLGQTKLNDAAGQGDQAATIVLIDTLTLAGREFTDVEAVVHRLPSHEGPCAGMLGFRIFRNLLLTMDYLNQRITLAQGELSPAEKTVLPYRLPEGIPVISMRIGDTDVDAHLDSGGAGLTLPESLASGLQYSEGPRSFGLGESLSTRFQIKAGKLTCNVKLGSATLEQPWVEITSALATVNIGAIPLQYFVVSFDQRHKLVRLRSPYAHIHLGMTPAPLQLTNEPPPKSAEVGLFPIG